MLRPSLPAALCAALLLCLLAPHALAQAPMTDAERARRDAEKVFNFIRFQTVRKPPAEGEAKPPRPRRTAPAPAPATAASPSPSPSPSPASPAPAAPTATAAAPAPAAMSAAASTAPAVQAITAPTASAPTNPAPAPVSALGNAPAAPAGATAAAEPEEDDEEEDGALRLVSFTAPELSLELQRTLGPTPRNIKVRFTVSADGRVTQAEAQTGTPRRLANVATQAIRQWRFDPLPSAREVDVEIAFKRD